MSTSTFTGPAPNFELPDVPHTRFASLALYDLTVLDGALHTTFTYSDEPFKDTDYSRFKYGFFPQAVQYGSLLAEVLRARFDELEVQDHEQIVLIGTPYKSLPNAAKLLTGVAERKLRSHGYATSVSRIYQHRLAEGDYGKLPAELRDLRNQQKKRFLDDDDFDGKHVVIVDDVRITGSIERSILSLLGHLDVLSLTIINLVRLDPEVAKRDPRVEDAMNHASVHTLADLLPLMAVRDQFVLITRTVKRILEAEQSELQDFLSHLETAHLIELHHAAVDEGYSRMEQYERSFLTLSDFYPY